MLKYSKFNYMCKNEKDELLIYNALGGVSSLCKTSNKLIQNALLDQKLIDDDCVISKLCEKGILINEDVDENAKLVDCINKNLYPNDLGLIISPTERCNFLCKYCYESHNNLLISSEVKYNIINYVRQNIHKYSGLKVSWFGGEPLLALSEVIELSQSFIKICDFNKRKYSASITTNGYLLDIDTFKILLKNRINLFQITIDGMKQMHDKQRPTATGKPTFDIIIHNLKEIKKLKNQNFHICIRSNLTKEIFDCLDEYIGLISSLCGNDNRFSLALTYAREWSDNISEEFKDGMIKDENTIVSIYKKFLMCEDKINHNFILNPEDGACSLGRNGRFFIRPNGEVHKCTVNFEKKENIIGFINKEKITIKDNVYSKMINPSRCGNLLNCFFAPVCKGDSCPAQKNNNKKCPEVKEHIKYVLQLLDKSKIFEDIDIFDEQLTVIVEE